MMYLIVPPIIIILVIAILIIFLARVLSTDKKEIKLEAVNENSDKKTNVNKKFRRSKEILKRKSEVTAKKIKSTLEGSEKTDKKQPITQGIVSGNGNVNGSKVVSLRKKSMVSDKMKDSEDRDTEEIAFMKNIEGDPQNSKKYENLADYYMEHEKFEDARECYKYVLRLDPRHKRAQIAMKNLDRIL